MDSKKLKLKKTKYLFNINIKTQLNKNEKDLIKKKIQKKLSMNNSQRKFKKNMKKVKLNSHYVFDEKEAGKTEKIKIFIIKLIKNHFFAVIHVCFRFTV